MIREKVNKLKADLKALRIALQENLVPWYAKLLIVITVAYAFSPVDLIPDFIPVIGLLDDLIILPLFMYLAVKMIPKETMDYCRREAESRQLPKRKSWVMAVIIVFIWILALAVLWVFLEQWISDFQTLAL